MTETISPGAIATEPRTFPPSSECVKRAHIKSLDEYKKMYKRSIDDPDGFWSEIAEGFYWKQKWTKVREYDFKDTISIKYFLGAKTNVTYNALDRHLEKRGDQTAGRVTSPARTRS